MCPPSTPRSTALPFASPPTRGRFAPSPTGRLHLGNARTALLGWLQARARGGQFLLRVEDLDPARSRAELADALLRDLEYLGLTWDEAPLFQSARGPAYQAALAQLEAKGLVYPCYCTRQEIARAATAPHGPHDEGPRYPGTCRGGAGPVAGRSPALRFAVPPGEVRFVDEVRGPLSQDVAAEIGDFVVRRNDGVASYQLAVVVDDAHSHITDVLRADDLARSTPRQLALYAALGLPAPRFAHVPLVLGEGGERLAKRAGPSTLAELRERKVPPERVIGLLARLCGLHDGSPVSAAELVGGFSLDRLPRGPAVVTSGELERLVLPSAAPR